MIERFTESGVRLRRHWQGPGDLNWLLLPGGPGIGAESLQELADILDVPGTVWLVDLPGDGGNVSPPGIATEPFANWPQVLLEAAQLLPNSVYLGHSTGGMYLLSVPDLEQCLAGMVLVSSAPDASWHPMFVEMTRRNPLPEVDAATHRYEAEPTNENLGDIAVASAEWNFPPRSVERGREFLSRMPYNQDAVAWSDRAFDHVYKAKWWPSALPTLILSGTEDRIVAQTLWNHPEFQGPNILHRTIEGGGHFLWFDEPEAVRAAFREFAMRISETV